jgi:hypothetical protein
MARVRRRVGIVLTAVGLAAGVWLVGMTPAGSVIGPNQGDITASSPAFPGGSVTFTVTTGSSCDPTSTFTPPNSTITVLDQAGTTTIVAATDMTPTATGGTVTVTLPSSLALGTYTMQFLCNHDDTSSIFGNNEFSVTTAPPTTTTVPTTTTLAPGPSAAPAAAAVAATPTFTG